MPVHLYGQACEMEAIMKIANDHNLFVVEDNAQAQGAQCYGKKTGSFGHVNATSFYPTKNLGALGEAGAVTTSSKAIAERIKALRNYGSSRRYYNDEIGYNNRIDEFEAAFLDLALDHLDTWNSERNKIAEAYRTSLKEIPGIDLFEVAPCCTSVNHLFVIKTPKRDQLSGYLADKGIGTQIHYPVPPHLQKAYSNLGHIRGSFPVAEELAETCLSLPLWPGLGHQDLTYVLNCLTRFLVNA
jgi:dTDP-4-amino-4,6-dideoxygalactose transaminase